VIFATGKELGLRGVESQGGVTLQCRFSGVGKLIFWLRLTAESVIALSHVPDLNDAVMVTA